MVSVFEVRKYDNNCPFNLWLEEFEESVLANFGDVANKRKKAILMQVCGEAVKKFVLSLEDEVKNDYPKLIKSISDKFTHHANETVERPVRTAR